MSLVLLAKSWKMLVRVCVCLCVVSAGHRHRPNLRQSPGGAGLQGALCRCRVARGMHLPFSKILHFPTLCCDKRCTGSLRTRIRGLIPFARDRLHCVGPSGPGWRVRARAAGAQAGRWSRPGGESVAVLCRCAPRTASGGDPHTSQHRCRPTATVRELTQSPPGAPPETESRAAAGKRRGLPCRRSASTARARSGYPGATARRTAPPSSSSSAKVRPLLLTPPAPLPAASDRARAAQGRTPRRRRAARAWRLGSCCRR